MKIRMYDENGDPVGQTQIATPLTEGAEIPLGTGDEAVWYVVVQLIPHRVDWTQNILFQPVIVRPR